MDPNQKVNQLDPKLKEAYERVMGTPVGNTPAAPQTPGTPPPPPAAAAAPSSQPTSPAPPPPPMPPMAPPQMQMPQPAPMPPSPMGTPQGGIPSTQVNAFGQPMQQQAPAPAPAQPAAAQAKPGAATHGFVANKKGGKAFPLILIVGGIIFLLVYTVFWFKFFNIPIPFLNQ